MTEVKKHDDFFGDKEGLRRSSPIEIAKYKAERIGNLTVADLGIGIGVQLIQFAMVSPEVLGIEVDKKYVEFAYENIKKYDLKNVKIIKGNVFESRIIREAVNYDVINSDPSRTKSSQMWKMYDLSPNPKEILRKYKNENFTFDLPLRIARNEIIGEPEYEYVSLYGEPKRLIVYYGQLKKRELSALSLPSGERIVKSDEPYEIEYLDKPMNFIYDLDQNLDLANVIKDFIIEMGNMYILEKDRQRLISTSDSLFNSPFIISKYQIIKKYSSLSELDKDLINYDYGKVYLRFNVDPKIYYKIKKDLEYNAMGLEDLFIFKFGKYYYTASKV